MSDDKIPWHREEIFHDEVANYPLYDYMFLTDAFDNESNNKENETDRF